MTLKVSQKQAEKYRDVMLESDDAAVEGLEGVLRMLARGFLEASDEEDRAPWRDAIIDEVYGRVDEAAAEKQAQADEWHEAMTGTDPAPHGRPSLEKAGARVRSAAKPLFERGDVNQFVASLITFVGNEIHAATLAAVSENCMT